MIVGGSLNALGVVRSLAQARMPIYLLETTRRCEAAWSRYCRYVSTPEPEGRGLIDALRQLAARLGGRPVLILTTDQSVNAISEWRGDIEPLYRISLPDREMVRAMADKTLFQALAEREGFAVPRAVSVTDPAGLERLGELQLPLIMKPGDKTLVLKGIAERAVVATTLAEAQRAGAAMLSHAPRVIVQEWIDGPDTEIYFALFSCDRSGDLLGFFPGRKLVCSPPAIGNTAVCVAAPEAANEMLAATRHFVERVGYRGLGSLEFKRDSRSGRLLIIEPTVGRTDWQEEIATLCGMNLPLLTYQSELGAPVPPTPGAFPAVAWRSSVGFRIRLPAGTRHVDGCFRWADPLPALFYYGYERILLRLWRRVASRPRRASAADLAKE